MVLFTRYAGAKRLCGARCSAPLGAQRPSPHAEPAPAGAPAPTPAPTPAPAPGHLLPGGVRPVHGGTTATRGCGGLAPAAAARHLAKPARPPGALFAAAGVAHGVPHGACASHAPLLLALRQRRCHCYTGARAATTPTHRQAHSPPRQKRPRTRRTAAPGAGEPASAWRGRSALNRCPRNRCSPGLCFLRAGQNHQDRQAGGRQDDHNGRRGGLQGHRE